MQLERELSTLASEIAWPPTPPLQPQLEPRRQTRRRPLLVAVALVLAALGVALAVPTSRAAILRFLHLGAVSIQFVDRLPAGQERPLGADLGPTVPAATARTILQGRLLLPPLAQPPPLHAANEVVSMLFRYHGSAVLLTELYDRDAILLKKLAGAGTQVRSVRVGSDPGLWLSGAAHLVLFPGAPPRLAGNVLLWQHGPLTLRLEGPRLSETNAQTLARALR